MNGAPLGGVLLGGYTMGEFTPPPPVTGMPVAAVVTDPDARLTALCEVLIELVRGSSATLYITDLVAAGGVPTTFAPGDVLTFSVRRNEGDPDSVAWLLMSSANPVPHVIYAGDSGEIDIAPEDWRVASIAHDYPAYAALQLARSVEVVTLWSAQIGVLKDV